VPRSSEGNIWPIMAFPLSSPQSVIHGKPIISIEEYMAQAWAKYTTASIGMNGYGYPASNPSNYDRFRLDVRVSSNESRPTFPSSETATLVALGLTNHILVSKKDFSIAGRVRMCLVPSRSLRASAAHLRCVNQLTWRRRETGKGKRAPQYAKFLTRAVSKRGRL